MDTPSQKSFLDLQNGDSHPLCPGIVSNLIFRSQTFIVYLDAADEIAYATDGYGEYPANLDVIVNRVSKLERLTARYFRGKEMIGQKKHLAQSIVSIFNGQQIEIATSLLNEAENAISKQATDILKRHYIIASVITTSSTIGFLLLLWFIRECATMIIGQDAFLLVLAFFFGGIGAFLSTFARAQKFTADVELSISTFRLEGFLRIFYGNIAGFIVALGMIADVVLGFIPVTTNTATFLFFAAIAGASEAIIPSLIKKAEGEAST